MDISTFQPLYVDCSMEYQLDMSRFPGWDNPESRFQPSLMIHLPESCFCNTTCLSDEDELHTVLQDLNTTEDELQNVCNTTCLSDEDELHTVLQDLNTTKDELQNVCNTTCLSDEDELHTVLQDLNTTEDELQNVCNTTCLSDEDELHTVLQDLNTNEDELQNVCNTTCLSDEDELPTVLQDLNTNEDELQNFLREFSTTEDELQNIIQDVCTYAQCTEGKQPSFFDDVLSYIGDDTQPPDTTTFMVDGQPCEDFLCDNTVQITESSLFSVESSDSPSVECDLEFFLCSPNGPDHCCRKRKISGDVNSRPPAKRHCYYGGDLLSELYFTSIIPTDCNIFEDEITYGFSVCVRD